MKTGFIDLLDNSINFYVYEKTGSDFELSDTSSSAIDHDVTVESLSPVLEAGIDELFLSLPLSYLTLREITFPFSDAAKINDILVYELDGLLLGNVNDYSIDHVVIETHDGSSRVKAVCIKKSKLREILDIFSSAGLDPKVITSIDLWLYGGNGENILGTPIGDKTIRGETAKQELLKPSINLRQHELSYTGDIDRIKKGLRMTMSLVLLLFIIIAAGSAYRLYAVNSDYRDLSNRMRTYYKSIFPEDNKIVDPLRQFQGKLKELQNKKAVLGGIPVLEPLKNIAELTGNTITLTEFSADAQRLLIKGTAGDFQKVDELKAALAAIFGGVKVLDSKAVSDREVAFSMTMQEKSL